MADEIEVTLEEKVLGVSFTEQGLQVQLNEAVNPIDITLDKYAVGSRGPAGKDGKNGKDGATGPKGDTGAQGPEGQRGPVGDTGPVSRNLSLYIDSPIVPIPCDADGVPIAGAFDDIETVIRGFEGLTILSRYASGTPLANILEIECDGFGITPGALQAISEIAYDMRYGAPSSMTDDLAYVDYWFDLYTAAGSNQILNVKQYFVKVRQGVPGV